ncbi:beta-L-arabinofuranosidase domain-containing protein [Streptomyces acidiscabies]|uniref:Glycoside hydrolase family 127 protein n=1 Tax=Streptomyces acidiscabies TaxID=42234 RepID=A0AAP6BJB9_9ACTN|nr:beta-L-arabinofuranosidase domain-containing protein [Streptomyces acidiscabies]MBP5935231.1 glycosylase [Streptomyces sp. LBUM 1476]MBZ3916940.1 glycoside hydrolase family 127 protein [Streptomyces acidiscabies]MDX2965527.1 glycoside hydrolase family 127 protein [Streptomyces acidiscabies]MDX3024248.1 glycoside hydrolase family 127 protein [Streptomyces acidiscabies]MDX3793055.1 glycoside hydrolase family 127 protein [Streptomyces acidiscabies]
MTAARPLLPLPLDKVSLGPGLLADKRQLMLDHARGYDVNRLLQVFRANAGLATLGAVAPGGWEGLDGEANGNLRGHYTGHFLTMLSQAYASTGDEVYAEKIRTIVGALTESREALRRAPQVLSVQGRFGTAAENVRGSYQYVELPAQVLGDASSVTLAAWIRPTHEGSWARVFDFGDDTTRYLYLAARNAAGVPRFAITTSGAGGEQGIDGTAALPLDRWSHLAVTIGGGVGTLYVNGQAVGRSSALTLTPAALGTLANNWLGRSNYSGDPVFAGAFGGFDVWSRALTAAEITGLQSGRGSGDLASYRCDETSGSTFADSSGRGLTATLRRTWGSPSHAGFLAAYPETQFIQLESMTASDYSKVWAPYYTAHKILRGLLDAYAATGDARALDLAGGMADWMHSRLSKLPGATLQRMWGLFSSGEFGGIVEALCDLYDLTGKGEHLALARLFDLDRLIDACAANTDVLDGLHANQHIPIFTGYLRLYDATGEERYLAAARNFWDMVVPHRMYSIGGTSDAEFWRARDVVAGAISGASAESCCAYNMLKLSRALFLHAQDAKYMDYYERALFNQVLGSKRDVADAEKPLVTYFLGLNPGHVRDYTPKQGTTCCEGTGLESATKYQDTVYFVAADGSSLYVNLFSPSTLEWAAKGVRVVQDTAFPFEQGTTLTVRGGGLFEMRLRVPVWAVDGFRVFVNGQAVSGSPMPGSYFGVSREWRDGDVVRVEVPFRMRVERTPDDSSVQAVFYGPVNLVARSASTSYLSVALYRNSALSGDLVSSFTAVEGKPLHFSLGGVEFAPFFEGTAEPSHVYVQVADPVKGDGSSLLDEV